MKVSEQWLREWVNPAVDSSQLSHQLTMAGLEVDTAEMAGPSFSRVVVGEVVEVEDHPEADKLKVCRVQTGDGETLQIVCGAPNVSQGQRVPTALIGATLPDGMQIKKARMRGVESLGMLCSAVELGLGQRAEGLMVLPADAPLGHDIRAVLDLDDTVYTLDLTPNRGDCLSIQGVAREVAAINDQPLSQPATGAIAPTHGQKRGIQLQAPEACPRYAGRIIQGVDMSAPSPLWLRERLRRSGLRPVGAVVDVTNYVMLELGQPLHAFDNDRLQGGISARMARPGERLKAISGDAITLDEHCLVIADAERPVALAGVMGGLESAVNDKTRDIFLESAYFTPLSVAGRGRQFKLHTDALHRYERGVDPEVQVRALERATAMILDVAGGQPGPVEEEVSGSPGERGFVRLRRTRVQRLLGTAMDAQEIESILQRLGMECQREGDGCWRVRPPSYRHDIALEADLIEEVARLHGFESLPTRERRVESRFDPLPEAELSTASLRQALIQRGYQEAITYGFCSEDMVRSLTPGISPVPVDNPIADTMSVMRTTLWAGLLPAWVYNVQHQQSRVRLFEVGHVYGFSEGGFTEGDFAEGQVHENVMLAGLVSGSALPEQWGAQSREVDFYDLKGDVESLLALNQRARGTDCLFRAEAHPALHPGQSARVLIAGQPVGWCGRLHPELETWFDLKKSCFIFEIEHKALTKSEAPAYYIVSEYPSVRRDIALVVDDSLYVDQIVACIRGAGETSLVNVVPFDVYRGDSVGKGRQSIAIGLIFQDQSRTLKDRQVDASVERIYQRLATELGATIRG